MDKRAIGIFDSGLGGLTAVLEFSKILPNENIIYLGDTGRVPYGTRSDATILKYTKQDINFLCSNDVKYVVAACGTVSCIASVNPISCNVPFTGVLVPACLAAVKASKTKKIGIIGTSATINSKAYVNILNSLDSNLQVFSYSCPLFVPLVENGFTDKNDAVTNLAIEHYLFELKQKSIDTLILGCTHYPIIKDNISKFIGKEVKLIDPGKETAKYVKQQLSEQNMLNSGKQKGLSNFYVTDTIDGFIKNAAKFLGKESMENNIIRQINIERF